MGKAKKPLPPGGDWKTIRGAKVLIKDGEVVAGAEGKLSGKKTSPTATKTRKEKKVTKLDEKRAEKEKKVTKDVKNEQKGSKNTQPTPAKKQTEPKFNKTTEKMKKKKLAFGGEWDGTVAVGLYQDWEKMATEKHPVYYKQKMVGFGDSKAAIEANNGGKFVSVTHEGETSGIALTVDSKSNKAVEVHYAEVAPHKREGKGVGAALIANAVAQSMDLGYDGHVFLRSDIDAIRFYEKIGMEYAGEDYKADLEEYEKKKGTRESADSYQRLSKKMREGAFFFKPEAAKAFYERVTGDGISKALSEGITLEQIIAWESEIDGGFRVGR